ncbi:MAG: PQQ-binding-like beta-propeller repeat protein [Clostridia bacterium]|nr:PQQ-binding-like beta-propeller repeat protein [Clostridia bacterium]
MRTKKNLLALLLALALLLSAVPMVYAAETAAETPSVGSLKWAAQIGSGYTKAAGAPIVVNGNIIVMAGDEIMCLNSETGETLLTGQMSQAQSYGYTPPTYVEELNMIFAPLGDGTVEAFDADTLQSKWVYQDTLETTATQKAMTTVTYSDGLLFTGFWVSETADADFVCLDAETGELKWSMAIPGGLYWAGAYCAENAVIFGTDNGSASGNTDTSAHLYSLDKLTGEIISDIELEGLDDVRSSVVYDEGRVYFTTKGGYICSAALSDGVLSDLKAVSIGSASTSTPTIYKGRIYIGASDKTIKVIDSETLEILLSIEMPAYPQCSVLLSNAYEEATGEIYLYATYNAKPGGIKLIKLAADAERAEDCTICDLYDAAGYEQYCISTPVADDNGVLYYKNDTGCVFAIEQKSVTVTVSIAEDGFILPKTEIEVPVGLAAKYGYENSSPVTDSDVSMLDAMVRIHEIMFGDDFTPETANDYFVCSYGWISLFLGSSNSSIGYTVNGKFPHDDVYTEYGYSGYTADQTLVQDGDSVEIFYYRDSSWYYDMMALFDQDTVTAVQNEEITLNLSGYAAMWYGYYDDETIASLTYPLEADIYLVDAETGAFSDIIGETDENGDCTLSFGTCGTYVISAKEKDGDTPIIAPWLEITVVPVTTEIDAENKKVTVTAASNENITVNIIAASYDDNIMTNAVLAEAELTAEAQEFVIDISELDGENIKVFVFEKETLCPIN